CSTCGNGRVDPGEQCDSGGVDTAACDSDCTLPVCGDRHVNKAAGEDCDEGGIDTPTCDADCTLPRCGDRHVNKAAGEECGDGNTECDATPPAVSCVAAPASGTLFFQALSACGARGDDEGPF